jgi:hypothetical protein
MWEQHYLIFDTFVTRAQLPLQYVFADHWLVDAWIVDEATRSQPSRLWLTLLVDAYSRAILGMALLEENPCIESIQTALRHAIWPKISHTACGVRGEWSSYGIPQQLFLDNALLLIKWLARFPLALAAISLCYHMSHNTTCGKVPFSIFSHLAGLPY